MNGATIGGDAHVVMRVGVLDRPADGRVAHAVVGELRPECAATLSVDGRSHVSPAVALSTGAGFMSDECRVELCAESIWPSMICAQLQ